MARVQAPPSAPPSRITRLIRRAAKAHGVEPALLGAVVKAESGFDPHAESPVGARGLLQLMPGRARAMGVSDPFDAAASLDAGARCLAASLCAFGGDLSLALAAYRARPRRGRAARGCARLLGYARLPAEGNGVLRRVPGRRHVRPPHRATERPRMITDGEGRCR